MTTPKSKAAADPEPLVGSGLGQVAYEAYSAAIQTPGGSKRPPWNELVQSGSDVATAWCAAAQAVITATIERKS